MIPFISVCYITLHSTKACFDDTSDSILTRTHGLVRNGLPRFSRRPRLCRRATRAFLQRRLSNSTRCLPFAPSLPLKTIHYTNAQYLKLHRSHSGMCQLLALIIIWNSWQAFNAGTTLALNFKSIMAAMVTNICASSGALTWALFT